MPKKIKFSYIDSDGSTSGQVLTSNGTAVTWGAGGGGGAIGDPFYGQTSLSLHFNNTNGNTKITYDSSPKGFSTSFVGSADLSTTQLKFGNSSLLVSNGTAGRVVTETAAQGGALDLATGNPDFTIETWAYPRALPASGANEFSAVVVAWGPVGFGAGYAAISIGLTSAGAWSGQWNSDNTGPNDRSISGNTASLNTWSHIAFTRQGNTFRIFVNGTLISNTTSTNNPRYSGDRWVIGSGTNNTYKFDGFIDDVRITKGVARYTASFTAPTSENPDYYAVQGTQGVSGSGVVGGGSNRSFIENDITITDNYTITSSKNAMTAGPVTINSGVVVTVSSGSNWTIV
jgi:hypothetical protein